MAKKRKSASDKPQPKKQPKPSQAQSADPTAEGLPETSPDIVEFNLGTDIDNIIPTRGYQMSPMVALGGSAGGISALQSFFEAMPADSGQIFVVILHLSPEHESILAEVLQRSTTMKVMQVRQTTRVQPNCVYVIPPGKILTTADSYLRLSEGVAERGHRTAVDQFFRTMADTYGPHASAIVLSGTDGDGAIGIKRIKERGGLTIAQDPDEAEHDGMPRSAIGTGIVDWVLQTREMPRRLQLYREIEGRLQVPPEDGPQPAASPRPALNENEAALRDVLSFLRTQTGRDFSYYKRATIVRRISRRLQVNDLDDLPSYLTYLRMHPGEAGALLKDLLISVTNFFRDRETFEALEAKIPKLFQGKGPNDAVRVWVPGCATGEEAYSLAILLCEYARRLETPPAVQVLATDLDDEVIQDARDGVFPETISADVSEERLRKFFLKEHRGYRVRREIRETVLFAIHDLLKDSPFSRLDMVSCRNLLIYLNREAQNRAFETFHFALNASGTMFLGSSESVDDDSSLFNVVDKKHRIYVRRNSMRIGLPVPSGPSSLLLAQNHEGAVEPPVISKRSLDASSALSGLRLEPKGERSASWAEAHFKLIERFGPPSLIVNAEHEILHLSENAGKFLQFAGGEPSRNILHLVHPTLRIDLRAALYSTAQNQHPTQLSGLPVEMDGKRMAVSVHVTPADDILEGGMLVVFETRPFDDDQKESKSMRVEEEPAARHLERELERVKSHLRDTIEQYEASTEELKAGNEELQAMNEELRSATEELETGREELQSINEELTTVNQELKSKVDQLGTANSDLHNLMASTAIATVFLDRELCITRYTPRAIEIFSLIPTDIGRPLHDLTHKLNYPDLLTDASRVLETLVPVERKVGEAGGKWYLGRILPYRTIEDRIAGVVLTFVDIGEQYRAEQAALEKAAEFRALFELSSIGLAQADARTGQILQANQKLCAMLGRDEASVLEMCIQQVVDALHGVLEDSEYQRLVREEIPEYQFESNLARIDGASAWSQCTITLLPGTGDSPKRIVLAVIDMSLRKLAEDALRESEEELRQSNLDLDRRVTERTHELRESEAKLRESVATSDDRANQLQHLASELSVAEQRERRRIALVLHDHIQQLLVATSMRMGELKDGLSDDMLGRAQKIHKMLDDAIVAARSLAVELVPPLLHDQGLIAALSWLSDKMLDEHELNVAVEGESEAEPKSADLRDLLFQTARELLLNVVKHADADSAKVQVSRVGSDIQLRVSDEGKGISRLKNSAHQSFGLFQIRERTEAAGGTFAIESHPGKGTRVTLRLPLA